MKKYYQLQNLAYLLTKNSSSNLGYKLIQRILKQEIQRLEKKG
jgi:hypothetical protein